jgi:hypothetical protein
MQNPQSRLTLRMKSSHMLMVKCQGLILWTMFSDVFPAMQPEHPKTILLFFVD